MYLTSGYGRFKQMKMRERVEKQVICFQSNVVCVCVDVHMCVAGSDSWLFAGGSLDSAVCRCGAMGLMLVDTRTH